MDTQASIPAVPNLWKYKCSKCGSCENVGFDANSVFNIEKQDWELGGHYDQGWCSDCGEVDVEQIDLDDKERKMVMDYRVEEQVRQAGQALFIAASDAQRYLIELRRFLEHSGLNSDTSSLDVIIGRNRELLAETRKLPVL